MSKTIDRIRKTKEALDGPTEGFQPKYRIISESLTQAILSNEYPEGSRLPSENELVRRFGVSRMTIGKALKELEQINLIGRRAGSGTYVNRRAPNSNGVFGLLIPELGRTEIFEPICQGMASLPKTSRHSLLWGTSVGPDRPKEEAAEELCSQYIDEKVSGVFFAPLELVPDKDEVNRRIVTKLDQAGIPVILLDRDYLPYPSRSKYDLVGIDNRRAAYGAVAHLLNVGAQKIAFLGKRLSAPTVDARIAGYREALIANGVRCDESLILRCDPTEEQEIERLLSAQHPDAFLCANDLTAANLMQSLIKLGVTIPEEVRVVGIDDVKYASLLPIPLTTLHQPCFEIGRVAMSAMLERFERRDLPSRDILLDCTLVVRKSCGSHKNL
jgi:DNA-binding LacI/PurR family transcriptional regulator